MRPKLLIGLAGLVVFAAAATIGYAASPLKGYDFGLAVSTGTALGTTVLAAATAWLAFQSRDDLAQTRILADTQKRDEDRKDSALLFVREASAYFPHGQANPIDAEPTVSIANVGLAPAFGVDATLEIWGSRQTGSGRTVLGIKRMPFIMPMSVEQIQITRINYAQLPPDADVTCINVQYRDKLTEHGPFKSAEPFWDITALEKSGRKTGTDRG